MATKKPNKSPKRKRRDKNLNTTKNLPPTTPIVIPAKAGIHTSLASRLYVGVGFRASDLGNSHASAGQFNDYENLQKPRYSMSLALHAAA
ncbi:MAG: hypothetical protein FVQ82_10705 [Planctomycetes bacterium]|nr:hypothetical protein [Planctomycetota bacterium]